MDCAAVAGLPGRVSSESDWTPARCDVPPAATATSGRLGALHVGAAYRLHDLPAFLCSSNLVCSSNHRVPASEERSPGGADVQSHRSDHGEAHLRRFLADFRAHISEPARGPRYVQVRLGLGRYSGSESHQIELVALRVDERGHADARWLRARRHHGGAQAGQPLGFLVVLVGSAGPDGVRS